jgi:hypothetical protein
VDYIGKYASGTISDVVAGPKLKGYRAKPRRIQKYSPEGKPLLEGQPRYPWPAKPVSHVYKRLRDQPDSTSFSLYDATTIGFCKYETIENKIMTPMQYFCLTWGSEFVKTNYLDPIPSDLTGRTYHGADWFSLMSEFNEGLDNLVPNSFFSGETIMEGGIFVDALKLMIRPKKGSSWLLRRCEEETLTSPQSR